ncbi:MAG: cation:proton antiporter [Myxococcales bacterium]
MATKRSTKGMVAYGLMLSLSGALLYWIRSLGSELTPSTLVGAPKGGPALHGGTLFHVLLALVVVIVASRLVGMLFRYFHQPAVIGEVVAGIALGPSLLGRIAPEASSFLFPPAVVPLIGVLAQIGVIVFMFLVGLDLDTKQLGKKGEAALAISHASILAPMLLGGALALWLYPTLAPAGVPFDVFGLFMGVAMSITAFPVLARILTDREMHRTHLGVLALSCAAVDDATAWCLLALVVGIAESNPQAAAITVGLTVAFMVFMFMVGRPLMQRFVRAQEVKQSVSRDAIALMLVGVVVCALIAEAIGIHAIFGAFLMGALVPADSLLARTMKQRLEDLAVVLLLPAFFAFTGLRTQLSLVSGAEGWWMCAAIVLVACAGKIGGTVVAARLTGVSRRDAWSLGALMNTRGLVELVALNIGLDLGVISPALFAMMVVMALVTTFATSPLITLLSPETHPAGVRVPNGG